MNFGEAIEAAKQGKKIAREGWNGKGMFVCYMPRIVLKAHEVNDRTRKFIDDGSDLEVGAYFSMWTAQRVWQPGWLASTADILGDDWQVLD